MKKILTAITTLSISSIAFANNSKAVTTPSLSSRSGFIISGAVALIFIIVLLSAGPNKKNDTEND